MFIAALFIVVKILKQLKSPLTDKWIKKSLVCIQWNSIQSFFYFFFIFITQWIYYIYSCTMFITIQFYNISLPYPQPTPPTSLLFFILCLINTFFSLLVFWLNEAHTLIQLIQYRGLLHPSASLFLKSSPWKKLGWSCPLPSNSQSFGDAFWGVI